MVSTPRLEHAAFAAKVKLPRAWHKPMALVCHADIERPRATNEFAVHSCLFGSLV